MVEREGLFTTFTLRAVITSDNVVTLRSTQTLYSGSYLPQYPLFKYPLHRCLNNGGERGIRTLGTARYTRFPSEQIKPL